MDTKITKTGKVVEHDANVFLLTDDCEYFLRRKNGDAYANTVWKSLVGRTIKVAGEIEPKEVFVVYLWEFVD